MTAEFFNQVRLDDTEAKGSYGIGLQSVNNYWIAN